MRPRQGRERDTHDVIIDPSHALVLQGVDHGGVINSSHDHRGREPAHVLFPPIWAFQHPVGQQDGFRRLYVVKRLGSHLVQSFVSGLAHPPPSVVVNLI